MAAYENDDGSWWMLYDITLTAYCSMIIMSRGLSAFQSGLSSASIAVDDVSATTLSVNIARRIMELANLGLGKYPTPVAAYSVFGAYRCYVAYGCLAKHLSLLGTVGPNSRKEADMILLEQVAQKMATIADKDKDLTPLVGTIYKINRNVRASWGEGLETSQVELE